MIYGLCESHLTAELQLSAAPRSPSDFLSNNCDVMRGQFSSAPSTPPWDKSSANSGGSAAMKKLSAGIILS